MFFFKKRIDYFFHEGWGVKQDYKRAFYWLDKAAKQGGLLAMGFLGEMYLHGRGVDEDLSKSIEFLTSSAKEGDEYSAFLLGEIYSMPSGNPVFSYAFFKWAAMLGHPDATSKLTTLDQNLDNQTIKEGKTLAVCMFGRSGPNCRSAYSKYMDN